MSNDHWLARVCQHGKRDRRANMSDGPAIPTATLNGEALLLVSRQGDTNG